MATEQVAVQFSQLSSIIDSGQPWVMTYARFAAEYCTCILCTNEYVDYTLNKQMRLSYTAVQQVLYRAWGPGGSDHSILSGSGPTSMWFPHYAGYCCTIYSSRAI